MLNSIQHLLLLKKIPIFTCLPASVFLQHFGNTGVGMTVPVGCHAEIFSAFFLSEEAAKIFGMTTPPPNIRYTGKWLSIFR